MKSCIYRGNKVADGPIGPGVMADFHLCKCPRVVADVAMVSDELAKQPEELDAKIRRDGQEVSAVFANCANCQHVTEQSDDHPWKIDELQYITTARMISDALSIVPKLPPDITEVAGIPRSGMIPAAALASVLHVPLYSLDPTQGLCQVGAGTRQQFFSGERKRMLVIDDTVYAGAAMEKAREQCDGMPAVFAAVYTRRPELVDVCALEVPSPHLLEWNLFNNPIISGFAADKRLRGGFAFDIDGVFCPNPIGRVSDRWLATVPPLATLPRVSEIPLICTMRLERWREQTHSWMNRHGVHYRRMTMADYESEESRDRSFLDAVIQSKAIPFRDSDCAIFVEDSSEIASIVAEVSGKPVLCLDSGEVILSEVTAAKSMTAKDPAVVFVSYRIPENRLHDFFSWNGPRFEREGVSVYVVTDKEYDVPFYAKCIVYPESKLPIREGKRTFSLAKTKNAGLAAAVAGGHDLIICSDVDIYFDDDCWKQLTTTPPDVASVPYYMMSKSWENRTTDTHQDAGATGTIAMRAEHWRAMHYDPRFIGYGAEDGKIMEDIQRAGIRIRRASKVWHIAHERDTPQTNFGERTDYHNPDFNPWLLEENWRKYRNSPTPDDPDSRIRPSLSFLKLLSLEIGRACDMAGCHKECPSGDKDRYGDLPTDKKLTDDRISEIVREAHDLGFNGEIAWHYYNEPLLFWKRMKPLMERLKSEVAGVKFCLWTNGSQIGTQVQPEELRVFNSIWVSNYLDRDWSFLSDIVDNFHVLDGVLDNRKGRQPASDVGCYRPLNEMIIDTYGNGHLCCSDNKGEVKLGNVWDDEFETVAERFCQLSRLIARPKLAADAPDICRTCPIRETRKEYL